MLQIFGLKLRYFDVFIIVANVAAVIAYLIVRARNKRILAEQEAARPNAKQERLAASSEDESEG